MKDNLKPTAADINKAMFKPIKPIPIELLFDPFGETPMSKVVNEYVVKVEEKLDNDIFGVCNQMLKDEGITYEYVLNKEFIVNAVKKRIAEKPVFIVGDYDLPICPECRQMLDDSELYCPDCGQKLDWSDTD